MRHRADVRRLLLMISIGALAATATRAQHVIFNPYLYVEQFYTDNVRFTRAGDSDTFTRLAVVLPVRTSLPRDGSLLFSYTYFVDRFNRFDRFDSESHRFNLGISYKPTIETGVGLNAQYRHTDDQGLIESREEEDLFLTPRVTRENTLVGLFFRQRVRRLWTWRVAVNYINNNFDRILGVEEGDEVLLGVQGREGFRGSLGLSRPLSEKTTVGLGYSLSEYDLDPRPDLPLAIEGEETIHRLSFYVRHQLTRLWVLDGRIGAFRRTGLSSGVPGDQVDLFREGLQGRLSAFRELRWSELELYVAHNPTSRGDIRGTSTTSLAGIAWRDNTPGRWDWASYARYALRDPTDRRQGDIESLAVGGRVEYQFARLLTLRFTSRWIDQTSDTGAADRSEYRVSLALFYYPLGRTRLGGGEGPRPEFGID